MEGGGPGRAVQPGAVAPGLRSLRDLNERFARLQQGDRLRPGILQNGKQPAVRRVSACEPKHPWRRSETFEEVHEIPVFAQHDRICLACCHEDRVIHGVPEAEVTDALRINGERPSQPFSDQWRELSVDPDVHAAMTG